MMAVITSVNALTIILEDTSAQKSKIFFSILFLPLTALDTRGFGELR